MPTVYGKITWKNILIIFIWGAEYFAPNRVWHFEKYKGIPFSWDDVISRRACWSLLFEKYVEHFILTVLSFTRWWGQLKRKVPNNEIRALSYNMVKYISENSKAAGYCSSSCQTQSRNIKNKGDWEKKQRIISLNIRFSQVTPISLQLVLH